MKYLVVSDIHLGREFSQKKFLYLKKLFSEYDQIILNGDFWDHYYLSFDEFVSSKWSEIFSLMKYKTVYIYGNHDKDKWSDNRVKLFSKSQTEEYQLKLGKSNYIFRHGDRIDEFKQYENELFIRFIRLTRLNFIALYFVFVSAQLGKIKTKKILRHASKLKKNEILVVGHKHRAEILLRKKCIFGGQILFGQAIYIVINEQGIPKIIKEGY